jgi:hypothetical protein
MSLESRHGISNMKRLNIELSEALPEENKELSKAKHF